MSKKEIVIKSGEFVFFAKDVRIIHPAEAVGNKQESFRTVYQVEVVLSGVPGTLQLRCAGREERDAEALRIENLVVKYHESQA
jgi:hypothetical protein